MKNPGAAILQLERGGSKFEDWGGLKNWRCWTFVSLLFLLLMTRHEETQLNALP